MLYGGETWHTTQKQLQRLEAFHQLCMRRILRIKWYQKITNERVFQLANLPTIRFLLGVTRMPDFRLPRYLLDWSPRHGSKSVGRQRCSWLGCVVDDLEFFTEQEDLTHEYGKALAMDRVGWAKMLKQARKRLTCGQAKLH